MNNLNIYIIIVTYNASSWVDKSIGKLINLKTLHKAIVVDNNSSDNTCELISKNYPEVDLIISSENIGFGRANNIGIKKAYDQGADYVLLLNQDAWLENDAIELLVKAHKSSDHYGLLSPVHLDNSDDNLDYNFCNYMGSSKKLISDLYLKGKKDLALIYTVEFVNAAIWLLPRKTIELVGGFNPLFFMYGEDREYVRRCNYHNLEVGVVPLARGHHGRPQNDSAKKKKKLLRIMQLVNLVDPGKKLTIDRHMRNLFSNALAAGFMLDFGRVRMIFSDLKYFFQNRRKIISSKEKNKLKDSSYL